MLETWREAQPDTYKNRGIRMIVEEEPVPYFVCEKDLDETCKVIRNRVHLFLNERK